MVTHFLGQYPPCRPFPQSCPSPSQPQSVRWHMRACRQWKHGWKLASLCLRRNFSPFSLRTWDAGGCCPRGMERWQLSSCRWRTWIPKNLLLHEPARDLFGKPLLPADEFKDPTADMRGYGAVAGRPGLATPGFQRCQTTVIHSLYIGVAPFLPRNCAYTNTNGFGDETMWAFLLQQHTNCVPLLRG